jgi:hypothetical protein
MGVVYLGLAPDYPDRDGSQVAIKVLRPELADNPEFRARFGREVASLMLCVLAFLDAAMTHREGEFLGSHASSA